MAESSVGMFRPAPGTPLVEIPNLMEAIGIADEKARQTALQLQEAAAAEGRNTAAQAAAARAGTIGNTMETPATILLKDNEQLKADMQKKAAMAAAGFSEDAASSVVNIMLQDIRDTGMRARAITEQLAADKAVSLFDDPLTAIANAFTIPWKEQELEGLTQQMAVRKKTLDDLTSGVTNVAAAANAGMAKVDAATIADRQRALAQELNLQGLKIEAAGLKDNISMIKLVREADAATLDRVRIGTQFYNDLRTQARADEHLAIDRKRLKMQEDEAIEKAKIREDIETEKALIKASDKERLRLINLTRRTDGRPEISSMYEFKSKAINPTANEKKQLEDDIERGRRLDNPLTMPTYSLGTTATGAFEYLVENGREPTTPAERAFVDVIRMGVAEEKKFKDTKGQMGDVNFRRNYVKQNWETYKQGDTSNPNAPISYQWMATDPLIGQHPLFKAVIAPTIGEGNKNLPVEPNTVFSLLTDAMIANPGQVNPANAARLINLMYQKSTELNNKNNQIFKWMNYQPEKLTTNIHVGVQPGIKLAADITTATGAAMMASGVGIAPGAAVSAVGLGAEAYALGNTTRNVTLTDFTDTQRALISKVSSKLGVKLNTTGTYPTGATPMRPDGSWSREYPPILESTKVIQGK